MKKSEKLRIAIVKALVGLSALVLLVCMCAFDSDVNFIVPMAISCFFIFTFEYANFYWKKGE